MRWVWLLPATSGCVQVEPHPFGPDLVFEDGRIYQGEGQFTDALAVSGGVVTAVGEQALGLRAEAVEVVSLDGRLAVPGFHDAHAHVVAGSFVLERVVLLGTSSMSSVLSVVEAYDANHPDDPWIVGYGWTPQLLGEPDGRELNVIDDRPVLLMAASGHSAVVNGVALQQAGIDAATPDPVGGTIVKDPVSGEPTGLLIENALSLVVPAALAAYDDAALLEPLERTLNDLAEAGVTSVSEIMASPGVDLSRPWLYTDLDAAGDLPIRVNVYLPVFAFDDLAGVAEQRSQIASDRVRFAGAKIWVDGSLSSLEGWTHDAYLSTGVYGSHYFTVTELTELVAEAEALAVPLKVHVMGDAAIDGILDAFESVANQNGGLGQVHVLDHLSLVTAEARSRMLAVGLVGSVQPVSRTAASLGGWDEELESWSVEEANAIGALGSEGVPLAFGTDWPVWPVFHPSVTLWSAMADARDPQLTREEIVDAYTAGSAFAAGATGQGCLDVDCYADLVVVGTDLFEAPVGDVNGLVVEGVWVGGVEVR